MAAEVLPETAQEFHLIFLTSVHFGGSSEDHGTITETPEWVILSRQENLVQQGLTNVIHPGQLSSNLVEFSKKY